MKYVLLFVHIAVATYAWQQVLSRKARRQTWREAGRWLLPIGFALVAVIALVFFNLNTNGKII